MIAAPSFRFDEAEHAYYLDGKRIPSITQLLDMGGLVNGAAYFTEESRRRGTEVHALCADWDMGALDPSVLTSNESWASLAKGEISRRPYLMAYMAACAALKPKWEAIEEADVHPRYGFAGRTDRVGIVLGKQTVLEIKSGAKPSVLRTVTDCEGNTFTYQHPTNQHAIQTALQSELATVRWPLPAEHWQRLVLYLKPSGKFSVERHEDRRDFDVAMDLIRRFCR